MMFSAAHPKNVQVTQKMCENDCVSLVVTGVMDGPDGVHRDIYHEVVYNYKDNNVVLIHFNTNHRLNYMSGWRSDHKYMGDPSAATEPFDANDVKIFENFKPEDLDMTLLIRLDSNEVLPVCLEKVKCDIDELKKQTIADALNGKLSNYTTKQLLGTDPL